MLFDSAAYSLHHALFIVTLFIGPRRRRENTKMFVVEMIGDEVTAYVCVRIGCNDSLSRKHREYL